MLVEEDMVAEAVLVDIGLTLVVKVLVVVVVQRVL